MSNYIRTHGSYRFRELVQKTGPRVPIADRCKKIVDALYYVFARYMMYVIPYPQ
jgi:hypothetical protein